MIDIKCFPGSTDNRKLCHDYHSERYLNMTKESSCHATAEVELHAVTTRDDHKVRVYNKGCLWVQTTS